MDDRYTGSNEEQKSIILKAAFGDDAEKEEYQEVIDHLYEMFEKDILDEYLVNGARLTCEKATAAPVFIDGQCFRTDICRKAAGNKEDKENLQDDTEEGAQTRLAVDRRMKLYGLPFANLSDTKKGVNIFPFGNCTCELTEPEKEWLKGIPEARMEGTCKYLMKLNERWDIFPRLEGRKYVVNRDYMETTEKGKFLYDDNDIEVN